MIGDGGRLTGVSPRRRYPRSPPEERALRSTNGICEPDSLASKRASLALGSDSSKNKGDGDCLTGVSPGRRYPRSPPEEQALRSTNGICEPDSLASKRASSALGSDSSKNIGDGECHLLCFLVEPTGVEPVSKSSSVQPSPWAVLSFNIPLASADRQAIARVAL